MGALKSDACFIWAADVVQYAMAEQDVGQMRGELSFIVGESELARRIRAHPWAETELGPLTTWPDALKTLVSVMLASNQQIYIVWGPDQLLLYNDRYIEVLQGHHPQALGRPFLEVWSEIAEELTPLVENAYAGTPTYADDITLMLERRGFTEEAHFTYSFTPVFNINGDVGGFICHCIETTEQVMAARVLRESETRHRLLIDSWAQAMWETDPAGVVVTDSPTWRAYTGQTLEQWLGYGWLNAIHPDDRAYAEKQWRDAMAARSLLNAEFRLHAPDGGWRWTNVLAAPMLDPAGSIEKWLGLNIDIHDRKQAETALRESEARFQQFANASAAGLWIRNADTLAMEYASPAIARIYGVEPSTFLGDMKVWAGSILPEDRGVALAHIEEARQGGAVVHEFRIQRADDGTFRWIRNTDFPLLDAQGRVQRIGGLAEDVTEAKLLTEHQGVLLAELQHRVRNIMAIIRSIAARSGERAGSVDEYAVVLGGRLRALSRVQTLLTRSANARVSLRAIVRDEVSVQSQHEGQYELVGPEVHLSPKAAEVLTLAIHELATNALKYGALSVPDGKVLVRWDLFDKQETPWLSFDWTEEGVLERPTAPGKPRRQGFGSELIEGRIPYELKGKGTLVIAPGGAQCHLEFPLRAGASVLETGAPKRATVFGGALDMTGEASLHGRSVLVVEDDFYLATDAARALRGAGAEVLGPCSTEAEAREELAARRPDAVLLDINLGLGPDFKLAETLKDAGIPFAFVTGYDQEIIPVEFDEVERLEKPVQLRQLVSTVAKLLKAV